MIAPLRNELCTPNECSRRTKFFESCNIHPTTSRVACTSCVVSCVLRVKLQRLRCFTATCMIGVLPPFPTLFFTSIVWCVRSDGVYVKYQVPGYPESKTPTLPHAADVTFEDTKVFLLSRIDRELLREFLNGPPMVFEVHDRDRKQSIIEGQYGAKRRGMFDASRNPDDAQFGKMSLMDGKTALLEHWALRTIKTLLELNRVVPNQTTSRFPDTHTAANRAARKLPVVDISESDFMQTIVAGAYIVCCSSS